MAYKESEITVETVLQSIEEKEGWWKQLEILIKQGQPVEDFISRAIGLIAQLEALAQNPESQLPKTAEEAARIKVLWIKSGPGTYFDATKDDRYNDKPWAEWMDRKRINYAFETGRQIAEVSSGQELTGQWTHDKALLREYGPWMTYFGRSDESAALAEALKTPWLRMPNGLIYPAEKSLVVHPAEGFNPDMSTINVINSFRLPPGLSMKEGDEIGVVAHTPQLARFLLMLPSIENPILANLRQGGVVMRMLPLPIPAGGNPEYPIQDLRGITNYRFIKNPPLAADHPYPVHG